jgi:hypothetical protein
MAVKPHSSTQKWICRKALRVSVIGIAGLSPARAARRGVRVRFAPPGVTFDLYT